MQFHQDGFKTGDPAVFEELEGADSRQDTVDVLIIGCGPAGLTLAAQLSRFPDISVRIAEQKSGPLEVGQADGIACRSVEMFQAFGFAEKVIKEGYQVNEVTFWRPGENGTEIARADRIQDVEDGLSEMPHIILSQARVHDFYLEIMRDSPYRLSPDYNHKLVSVTRTEDRDYPIKAVFDHGESDGQSKIIRARFVVGCDGARSRVREEMGHVLKGQSARQLWGVMDILPRTDFPDIRLKCAIQSANSGSILIIPREGGYLVRLYIELDELDENERASDRNVNPEQLVAKAQEIVLPYHIEAAEVAWCSAYEIGQRVCDAFDDVDERDQGTDHPRVFIAGDACHTHSPKAGQGMNVSMADAFNLGWKLAAVLRHQSQPELLRTYSQERRAMANELIEFDKDMARLFSAKPKTPEEALLFQQYFQKHGRYTAGVETCYAPSLITADTEYQDLAAGYPVGKRFHSAPVVRVSDAKPMHLASTLVADGRWRIIAFAQADDDGARTGTISNFCADIAGPRGLLRRHTNPGLDIDGVIDVRAVFQQPHDTVNIADLPPLLLPVKGRLNLIDYEKVFCASPAKPDIFDVRSIDRKRGVVVIVRPDQYVAHILPIEATGEISAFFEQILRQQ